MTAHHYDLRSIASEQVGGKRVLVRVDFNVPIRDGEIQDDTRIRAGSETVTFLAQQDATVIVMSHLGRPDGKRDDALSLKPVAERLSELIERPVRFVDDCIGPEVDKAIANAHPGDVIMLENTRFHSEDTANDAEFARSLARLADLYVNDAFGTVHRANASTAGVAAYIPAFAGFLLEREVHQLSRLLSEPSRPFVAVVGGVKVSDKIGVLESFSKLCDAILVGGAMAFTFHAARGIPVGSSKVEGDEGQDAARRAIELAEQHQCSLMLPTDVLIAQQIEEGTEAREVSIEAIPDGWMGLDIGPRTRMLYTSRIRDAHTVFWNGPMGVFEVPGFDAGTRVVAEAVAACPGTTVVGGGDSVSAVSKFGLADRIDHVSTGGGASLAFLEGEKLPGLEAIGNSPQ